MAEYATKQDIAQIVKSELRPVYERLGNVDARLDRLDARTDNTDARFDNVDAHMERIEIDYRRMLVQYEAMDSKLDAILEYVSDVPEMKTRLTRLEETVQQEQSKSELDRYHLSALRHDFDNHKHT